MTFKVTHANTRVYVNQSGGNRVATFAVSGAARLELKAGGGGHVLHYTLNAPGGVVSLQVPAQHWVEVDTAAPVDVQVDVHDGA